ncbi:MAG: YrbL family protein [Gammaproteobacteria bacterium]
MRTVILSTEAPFARGGNRLCFVHPDFPDRVIKVRRPDFSLEDRRRKKGFPKNLRPCTSFDDNAEEKPGDGTILIAASVKHCIAMSAAVSGFEDSDMGKGLVSD